MSVHYIDPLWLFVDIFTHAPQSNRKTDYEASFEKLDQINRD